MNEFLEIATAVSDAAGKLSEVSDSPKLDAELLLARALDVQRSYLFAHPEESLDDAAIERFFSAVAQRSNGIPLAYITGVKDFWSMSLQVSKDTLVPRPETELLVSEALQRIPANESRKVLDLGTGSGAIAIAIAKERPHCEVIATDISDAALHVARENARQHGIANLQYLQGNWVEPVVGRRFDIVACNPPYIRDDDPALHTLRHEPRSALASGISGLDAIRQVSSAARAITSKDGVLLLEHGDSQEKEVHQIFQQDGWCDIQLVRDLADKPRVTIAMNR